MAYPSLVVSELTPALIEAGAALVQRLDADGVQITAAFWIREKADSYWRLALASPLVIQNGVREFYSSVHDHIRELADPELSLSYVIAKRPDDPLVLAMKMASRPGNGLAKKRLTDNVLNGIWIPDVLVYRG